MVIERKEMGQVHWNERIEEEVNTTGHKIYKQQLRILKTRESKTYNLDLATN